MIFEKQGIDRLNTEGFRPKITLEMAALRYLEEKAEKTSLETDIYLLKEMIKICGTLPINEINNETLKVFVNSRKIQGIKNKTINSALAVVRHICNLASSSWRLPNGMTWLEHRPVITLLDLNDQRPPRPISWKEQERLLEALPFHLKDTTLFILNTGVRSNVVCQLRWEWEYQFNIAGKQCSLFIVPRRYVKGRKQEKIIVCNSVAQQVIDNQRGRHDEFVFTFYRVTKEDNKPTYKPIRSLHNTAWQRVRREVGLDDLHVHDLRHTVGMRLRMAGVAERTQDEILWHSNSGMSSHYAAAQIREIYDALELISKKGDYEESMDLLTLLRQAKLKSRVEQT